ncbi:MAG: T9SS type A sorting domain-containing protein [Bacteroidetes bacterium]|nr:T9SS type A sorting domain-containing protein [Bacteroidota bacterium]
MKRIYLPICLMAIFFLSISLTTKNQSEAPFSLMVVDTLMPILPETPYNYKIDFPEYINNNYITWIDVDFDAINNKIDNKIATVGRVLFYDKRLSASNDISCATCHQQQHSFADNRAFSQGIGGTMASRNTPCLNDVGWAPYEHLFWDYQNLSLEQMVLLPIQHEGEMGKDLQVLESKLANTAFYPELFADAFGSAEITAARIAQAIAQFVRSINTFNSQYDKIKSDEAGFTNAQRNGYLTFQAHCSTCHNMSNFNTEHASNNGLDSVSIDVGMEGWSGNPSVNGFFRSPSLRNIALTAPYMHDGRFATLDEVLDFYSEGIQPNPHSSIGYYNNNDFTGFGFTAQEKLDLKHFLLTLTDSSLLTDIRFSDPFNPISSNQERLTEKGITIAPNPFHQTTNVHLQAPIVGEVQVHLMDMNGKTIQQFTLKGTNSFQLHRSDLPAAGVYWLVVENRREKWVKKLAVE